MTTFERLMVVLGLLGACATAALSAWKSWPPHPVAATNSEWDCGVTAAGRTLCLGVTDGGVP